MNRLGLDEGENRVCTVKAQAGRVVCLLLGPASLAGAGGTGRGGAGGRPLAHSSKSLSRLATLVVKEAVPVSEAFTTLDSHC